MTIRQKTALITGSTSGIGLGIARVLASQNNNILLNGLGDPSEISKIIEELSALTTGKVLYSPANLTSAQEIKEMVAFALKSFPSLDIVVNNAGMQHVSPTEDFPEEKWDQVLNLNLKAPFLIAQQALKHMRAQKWGRIINIASAHGLVASTHKAAYVASKHGLVGLTKVIALETAQENITCNAVCPGWVLTPLVQKQIEEKAQQKGISIDEATHNLLSEKQPSGSFVLPEQVGEYVAFLCSDAAAQITGTVQVIDGGWTAQ